MAENKKKSFNGWWMCDNIVNKPDQIGLLHTGKPSVFILIDDYNSLYPSRLESFKAAVSNVRFFDPEEVDGCDTDAILEEAFKFLKEVEKAEDENIALCGGMMLS